jgi:hypothetical protein
MVYGELLGLGCCCHLRFVLCSVRGNACSTVLLVWFWLVHAVCW